jgi:hypothetical protein
MNDEETPMSRLKWSGLFLLAYFAANILMTRALRVPF